MREWYVEIAGPLSQGDNRLSLDCDINRRVEAEDALEAACIAVDNIARYWLATRHLVGARVSVWNDRPSPEPVDYVYVNFELKNERIQKAWVSPP